MYPYYQVYVCAAANTKYTFLYQTKIVINLNELKILKELEQIVKEKQPTWEPAYMGTSSIEFKKHPRWHLRKLVERMPRLYRAVIKTIGG